MKVKIQSHPKRTLNVDRVFFSSDLHINHEAVIKFGRKYENVTHMNDSIVYEINKLVRENDLLVLMGDTMMVDKNYIQFLNSVNCKNVIMLYGNHCNPNRFNEDMPQNLIFHGYYLELNIERQIVCCSHYPMFNWNYQDKGSFMLHGHLHGDENTVIKEIHKYKTMDVGLDSHYNMFEEYSLFSFEKVQEILKNKLTIGRHE